LRITHPLIHAKDFFFSDNNFFIEKTLKDLLAKVQKNSSIADPTPAELTR
jgi:hypothetical protein